jgi:carotenoid cleavage dioxygenase
MGAFSDGEKLHVDMDMAHKNQFPFFPNLRGEMFDPIGSLGRITRLTVDLAKKSDSFDMEVLFPEGGVLPRQDDRYHTVPYRYGFMPTTDHSKPFDERLPKMPYRPLNCYTRFDQTTRKTSTYFVGPDSGLQECCFVPRRPGAPEGDGYLVGIANRLLQGRSDLIVLDTAGLESGPIATIRLPFRTFGQVHGWWVSGEKLIPSP